MTRPEAASIGQRSLWRRFDPRRSILALGAGLTVLSVLLFAIVAEVNRRSALEDAARSVRTLAATLAEHAARIVDVGNLIADQAIDLAEGRSWEEIEATPDAYNKLRHLAENREFVNAVWLIDAAGLPRVASRSYPAPRQSVADRKHFIVQKEQDVGPYLSSLLQSRVVSEVNMVMSRRLSGPGGDFRGVALVVVNPGQFEKVYREVQPKHPATIEILREDGTLVLRHQVPDGKFEGPPADGARPSGQPSRGIDDSTQMTAYRQIGTMPLFIAVGVTHADVTRRWLKDTVDGAVVAAAVLGVLLLFVMVAAVRSGQEAQARAEIEALNATLESRIRDRTATVERLMVEVNHRAKNSLQMVSSLLHMHARRSARTDVRQELEEARSRVLTIARVHDRLYRADHAATVKLDELLTDVGEDLGPTLVTIDGFPVNLSVKAASVELGVDKAVPLALAVNELVTNSVKYAFSGRGNGHVWVNLSLTQGGSARLTVEDDGTGLKEGFEPSVSSGLGMGLVTGLVRQAGGVFSFGRSERGGARFVIDFPIGETRA